MPRQPTPPPADGPKALLCATDSARRPSFRDKRIAGVAKRQHGVIALSQLQEVGLSAEGVRSRVKAGRLHPIHQGVYAVGHPRLTRDGEFIAAVLACGPDAVLSHRSAAELWGLVRDCHRAIDVTAPHRRGRSPRGIAAHRDERLAAVDRTVARGVPCTGVPRTLLDFAGSASFWELRRVIEEAEVKRLLDVAAVRALIGRSRGRRGVAQLRVLIDTLHPDTKKTRSRLERRFLRMCERVTLPTPEVNVLLDLGSTVVEADFLWRDRRLIVETDGRESHDTASAFENDRLRDQHLMVAGWRVLRCTWHQVSTEPTELGRTIRTLLKTSD